LLAFNWLCLFFVCFPHFIFICHFPNSYFSHGVSCLQAKLCWWFLRMLCSTTQQQVITVSSAALRSLQISLCHEIAH
jgi:hypothetical protein